MATPNMELTHALSRRIRTQPRLETTPRDSKRIARSVESCGQWRFVCRSSWTRRSVASLAQWNIREARAESRWIIDRRRSLASFRAVILQSSSTLSARLCGSRAHSRQTSFAVRSCGSRDHSWSSGPLGVDLIGDLEGQAEGTGFRCCESLARCKSTSEFTVRWRTVMDRPRHADLASTWTSE